MNTALRVNDWLFISGRCLLCALALWMLAAAGSCRRSNRLPEGVLEKQQMMNVLADVAKAEEFVNTRTNRDTTLVFKDEVMLQYKRVFVKNGITREQFFKSIQYYLSKPYLARDMFDTLQAQTRRNAFDRMAALPETK